MGNRRDGQREGGAVKEQSGEKGYRSDERLYSVNSPNMVFSIAVFYALPQEHGIDQ